MEETALSIWLRESGTAFFSSLTLHSLAMAFVVGINLLIALRLLGGAPGIPPKKIFRFYTPHWYAVGVIFLSGIALLIAYPAKALTNPVFYIKLVALTLGLIIAYVLPRSLNKATQPLNEKLMKLIASCSILLWIVTITAGRFLAYTHDVLLASRFY